MLKAAQELLGQERKENLWNTTFKRDSEVAYLKNVKWS